jgi:hypothetical protein
MQLMPLSGNLSSKRSRPGVRNHPEDVEMSQTIGVGGSIFLHKPDGKDMKTETLKRERSIPSK